jgi:hypothetical protein
MKSAKVFTVWGAACLFLSIFLLAVRDTYISDIHIDHSLVPWLGGMLYQLQRIGFIVSSVLFPCQKEGFDIGCEPSKVVPTILVTNAIVYFVVLMPIAYIVSVRNRTSPPSRDRGVPASRPR